MNNENIKTSDILNPNTHFTIASSDMISEQTFTYDKSQIWTSLSAPVVEPIPITDINTTIYDTICNEIEKIQTRIENTYISMLGEYVWIKNKITNSNSVMRIMERCDTYIRGYTADNVLLIVYNCDYEDIIAEATALDWAMQENRLYIKNWKSK